MDALRRSVDADKGGAAKKGTSASSPAAKSKSKPRARKTG